MSSVSFNSSQSSSKPVETTENGLIDQLSGVAAGLAGQMTQWAQQEYAKTSQVTDQTVGNFLQASNQMMGLSSSLTGQYNNLFAPENAALVRDADSYASTDRQQVDMGQAGATQQQAGDQALKNSEANLVSMGIDPSSGRYAALDKAAAVQNAANVAGAENMQRNQDIQTGQALRSQAVQVGSQLPAAIANTTNAATQANTGASNASLANANTGANLQSLADKYLSTAMGIKLPPSASQSTSSGTSSSSQPAKSSGSSSSGASGGNNGLGTAPGGGGTSWAGMGTGGAGASVGSAASRSGSAGGGASVKPAAGGAGGPDWTQEQQNISDIYGAGGMGGVDSTQWTDPGVYSGTQFGSGSMGIDNGTIGSNGGIDNLSEGGWGDGGFGQTLPNDGGWSGGADQTFGNMSGGTDTQWGNISYDPTANQSSAGDSWGQQYNDPSSTPTDWGSSGGGSTDWSGSANSDQSFQDYGYTSPDMSGGDSGYAGGGAIQPTQGGAVHPSMSPSGGARTDDVRANLNEGEFVLPKDVTRWKGEEFMHNLIAQSRKKRMQMQAALGTGGKPMPAGDPRAKGPSSFQSRPMGGR